MMQRMRLVHPDRLASIPASTLTTEGKEELKMPGKKNTSDDVQLAEFQDAFIRKQDKKKNLEEKNISDFAKKIKPLLAGNISNMEAVLKAFSGDDQIVAQNILNILARIPRVSFNNNKLLIDGEAVKEDLVQIIKDMMQNNINGAESVIQVLRGKMNKNSGWDEDDDDDYSVPFARSFDETLIPYLAGTESGAKRKLPKKGSMRPPVHQSTPMPRQPTPGPPSGKKSPPYKLRQSAARANAAYGYAPEQLKGVNQPKSRSKVRRKLNKSAEPSPRRLLQQLQAQEAKDNGGKAREWLGY